MNIDSIFSMTDEFAITNEILSSAAKEGALNVDEGQFRFSLYVVRAIGQAGEKGRVMKRYLFWAFDHCGLTDKPEVIKSIGLIGDRDRESISRVVSGFRSELVALQASSAHAFGNLRLIPKALQEPMLKGVESSSSALRGSCLYALNRAIPVVAVPLRLIEQTIFDEDLWVRCESLKAVELSKVVSSQIADGVVAAIVEQDGLLFRAAIDVLICLGSAGVFARPSLERILEKGNALALVPLWKITGGIAQYRYLFPKLLENCREEFCDAIYHIGKDGAVAIPTLVDALADPDWDTCLSAVDAVSSFGFMSEHAIPALKKLFDHESQAISDSAREAVNAIEADMRRVSMQDR